MDQIDIKNEDISRLIIDLLIKNATDIAVVKELVVMNLAATVSSAHRDTFLTDLHNGIPARHKELAEKLKEQIFAQYGFVDLEGL